MRNTMMEIEDVYCWLIQEEEGRKRELKRFSDAVNEYLYLPHDPTPEDLYNLGRFLSNAGGSTDEVAISLIRLAALQGHKEALERYESRMDEKLNF